tara:strand:+ start:262 stop:1029 length:768 start_codon:yes stop_codon:yes gene_type:complete
LNFINYKKDVINELNEGIGFSSLPAINEEITSYILKEADNQIKEKFKKLCPDNQNFLKNDSIIESFENIESSVWPKLFTPEQRTLNKNAVSFISEYLKKYLINTLGKNIIFGDYLGLGYPSFSLRIVRPNCKNDIGPLHADQWFIDIGSEPFTKSIKNYQLIKLWLPIQSDPKLCNLLVIPNSHKKKNIYKYKIINTDNGKRPGISNNIDQNQLVMVDNPPGCPLIFNMSLIHGGSINKSKQCRVSLEFKFHASI